MIGSSFVIVLLMSLGCATEDYSVVIRNAGRHQLDRANVTYGEFNSGGGVIIPGSIAGHGHPGYPIPDKATVEWRTEDGQIHQKVVEVRKLIPLGFSGDIYFDIDDSTNVTVRPVPRR